MSLAASITLLGALFGGAAQPPSDNSPQTAQAEQSASSSSSALPLELTAFGDVYYARSTHPRHGFHIGSLEVGVVVVLKLVPFVHAFGAIAYDTRARRRSSCR